MKKGARVINCARGGIINEEALAEALQVGPSRRGRARRVRAGTAAGRSSAAQAAQRRDDAAPGRVDRRGAGIGGPGSGPAPDRLPDARRRQLRGQHGRRRPRRAGGDCGSTSTWPAGSACCTPRWPGSDPAGRAAAIAARWPAAAPSSSRPRSPPGLLESRLDQNVNIVNAELLARERGIEIVEQSASQKGRLQHAHPRPMCITDKKTYTAAGTLFGNQYPAAGAARARTISTPSWTASCCSSRTATCRA